MQKVSGTKGGQFIVWKLCTCLPVVKAVFLTRYFCILETILRRFKHLLKLTLVTVNWNHCLFLIFFRLALWSFGVTLTITLIVVEKVTV